MWACEGPSSRWTLERDISHTTINCDWASRMLPGCPSSLCVSVSRQAWAAAGCTESVPAQENTHRASSHRPAAALDSRALPLSLFFLFHSFHTVLTTFHHMPTLCMYSRECKVHGSQPQYSPEQLRVMKCCELMYVWCLFYQRDLCVCVREGLSARGLVGIQVECVFQAWHRFVSFTHSSIGPLNNICFNSFQHAHAGFVQKDFLLILKANTVPLYNVFPCFVKTLNGPLQPKQNYLASEELSLISMLT